MANNEIKNCVMTDWYGSDFSDDVKPTREVRSVKELHDYLTQFRDMEPRIVHLNSESGTSLRIGIAGELGHVYVDSLRNNNEGAYIAVAPSVRVPDDVVFVYDSQPSYLPPKYLLPLEDVEKIVLDILTTGMLPKWIEWDTR